MVNVGDLCWDMVTQALWVVKDVRWCPLSEDYKYDLMNTKDLMIITTNDTVVTNMRADFLKRTKNVLDKSEE
tara:strand:- start:239 stop:454 length:216 start_codon:yes stop_codon:yes gene_type:complete